MKFLGVGNLAHWRALEVEKSKIKVPADLVSFECLFLILYGLTRQRTSHSRGDYVVR
jgi:hypothetical protein